MSVVQRTDTAKGPDNTWLIGAGMLVVYFMFFRKHDDDDENDAPEEMSEEDKKRRGLLIFGALAAVLVFNNQDALKQHLPLLSPLAVSNYAKEFGASPSVSTICAVAAYILLGGT